MFLAELLMADFVEFYGYQDISSAGRRLAMNVIKQCAVKLEPCINKLLISALSRTASSQNGHFDHHEAIYEIYCGAPQILHGVVAYMIEELSVVSPNFDSSVY